MIHFRYVRGYFLPGLARDLHPGQNICALVKLCRISMYLTAHRLYRSDWLYQCTGQATPEPRDEGSAGVIYHVDVAEDSGNGAWDPDDDWHENAASGNCMVTKIYIHTCLAERLLARKIKSSCDILTQGLSYICLFKYVK